MAEADERERDRAEVERADELPLIARLVRLLLEYLVPQLVELGVVHAVLLLEQADVACQSTALHTLIRRLEVVEHCRADYQVRQNNDHKRNRADVVFLHDDPLAVAIVGVVLFVVFLVFAAVDVRFSCCSFLVIVVFVVVIDFMYFALLAVSSKMIIAAVVVIVVVVVL